MRWMVKYDIEEQKRNSINKKLINLLKSISGLRNLSRKLTNISLFRPLKCENMLLFIIDYQTRAAYNNCFINRYQDIMVICLCITGLQNKIKAGFGLYIVHTDTFRKEVDKR